MKSILFLISLSLTSCSTFTKDDLLNKKDYQPISSALKNTDYKKAYADYPRDKEQSGLITSMEKAWLALLAKEPYDNSRLTELGQNLDHEKTLSIRQLGEDFFYKESEDGYFPGEHESIMLHILNGMIFLREGKYREA